MSISLKDEVQGAAFGDQRLTKRLGKVIEELGAKPAMSVPAATRGRAEMEAAYRFFDNDKVSPEKVLQPHIEATRERISQAEVVLLVQDTTDIRRHPIRGHTEDRHFPRVLGIQQMRWGSRTPARWTCCNCPGSNGSNNLVV